ncbi:MULTISPECIES: hypothetical protein [Fischerella]|uniref:hypothetical protein n=1 Tax=Fischerella sp. FACHB-380 TaxID=2692799 RepID=UPI0002E8BDBD|nr:MULTISPECIES: hypothetical protein [Fischerella]
MTVTNHTAQALLQAMSWIWNVPVCDTVRVDAEGFLCRQNRLELRVLYDGFLLQQISSE